MKRLLTIGAAMALSAACVIGVTGCASNGPLERDTGLTGGVAATVNGAEIPEDKITKQINTMRMNADAEKDDAWAEYLHNMSYTPTSLRDQILEGLIDQELVKQFAADEDCAATDEEIQGQIDAMRGNYSSDEAWEEALDNSGYDDEQAYRDALQYSIAYKKLQDKFSESSDVDEAALIEQAQSQLANVNGDMRRSSHILFNEEDQEKAQEVLGQLKAGEITFEDAAKQYSQDTGSATDGGDVGWDGMNTFVEEYQTALGTLQVGQMTDLVQSEYGYHIIKCTDLVTIPETITSTDQVPEDIMADIRTSASSSESSDAMETWIDGKEEASEVVINDMPENVPYNVDMSAYETEEEEATQDEAADEALVEDVEGEANALDEAEAEADLDAAAPAAEGEGEGGEATSE